MTLSELRTIFLDNVGDPDQDVWTTAMANRLINAAMHHVENLLVRDQVAALMRYEQVTASNSSSARVVLHDMGANLNVRRLIRAESPDETDDDKQLKILGDIRQVDSEVVTTLSSRPRVFQWNNGVGFVGPTDGLSVDLWYVAELPDMTADTDVPGQAGGSPSDITADLMPLSIQPLIPSYAAVLALAGDNEAIDEWSQIFVDQMRAALAALGSRPRGSER